jgi:hypothetical protein
MSKKFNVKEIVDKRRNELDHSPLFQSRKPDPVLPAQSLMGDAPEEPSNIKQQNASKPESQNAGKPVFQQTSKMASQTSSMPDFQKAGKVRLSDTTTSTEKVTYRFHSEEKYAVEDMKTVLARKFGIKASLEEIAEEAILIIYEDLLENRHASKLASRLAGKPENKKSS